MKDPRKVAYEENKLDKKLCRLAGQAIVDYNMIEDGDKVMVCMSGGKDSYAMLDILMKLKSAPRFILIWWQLTWIKTNQVFQKKPCPIILKNWV